MGQQNVSKLESRRQWVVDRALLASMRSSGRPEPSRAVQREFWRLISTGITAVEASVQVGVSSPNTADEKYFAHGRFQNRHTSQVTSWDEYR